jgi:hypothetical protein
MVIVCAVNTRGQETTIRVDAAQSGKPVSKWLTGSCVEDVNHEVYGGIYSQMVFGESFAEPMRGEPVKGMAASEGEWKVSGDGVLEGSAGQGPKLIAEGQRVGNGEVGVDVFLPGSGSGNAGLVVRTNRAGPGADNFDGYEISIDAARKVVVVGRHRHDFRSIKEAACDVVPDKWTSLGVKLKDRTIEVLVDGKSVAKVEDPRPLGAGAVGVRQWQRAAKYRNLWVSSEDRKKTEIPFVAVPAAPVAVSGMWRPVVSGSAKQSAKLETENPFVGAQSQRIEFLGGSGEAGIENRGLNRRGMCFVAGKPYDGYVWARAAKATKLNACMESGDGTRRYGKAVVAVEGGDQWRGYEFSLTPDAGDQAGRFAVTLSEPGAVVLGHVFLQPGEWGRFKGLPLRKDVTEGLIAHGITVMRYGGSMVNADEYRWKKMIGPREKRPPYRGTWYPYSSNGWGIMDFLDMCEAAGFVGVPALNVNESAQDLADLVEYVNGPADSEWGRRRAADGHAKPYGLKFMELGNEERVNDSYYAKFEKIAQAIWGKDSQIILVVGDFQYERKITDPMNITGAASRITSLAGQKKILELAAKNNREVWFDVHIGTEGPGIATSVEALPSFIDAIDKIAGAAKHRVVVFELNANNHEQRRALANAVAIGRATRDGRLPIVTSANALQVDGQNDNGWNQGLLFMNPATTWIQPPGYVTQMISKSYEPRVLDVELSKADPQLDVTAVKSEDGKAVALRVVNTGTEPRACEIRLDNFKVTKSEAQVEELSAPLNATNTATDPTLVKPRSLTWKHGQKLREAAKYTFPPSSFTVLRIE